MTDTRQRWCGLLETVRATIGIQLRSIDFLKDRRDRLRESSTGWNNLDECVQNIESDLVKSRQVEGCLRLVIRLMVDSVPANLDLDFHTVEQSVNDTLCSALMIGREFSHRLNAKPQLCSLRRIKTLR